MKNLKRASKLMQKKCLGESKDQLRFKQSMHQILSEKPRSTVILNKNLTESIYKRLESQLVFTMFGHCLSSFISV